MDPDVVDRRATVATIDPDRLLDGLDRIAALPNLGQPAVLQNVLGVAVVLDGTFTQHLIQFDGVEYEGSYSFSRYKTRPARSEDPLHGSVAVAMNSNSTGYRLIRSVDITARNMQDFGCLPVQGLITYDQTRPWSYLPSPDGGAGSYVLRLEHGRMATMVLVSGDARTGCVEALRIIQGGTGKV